MATRGFEFAYSLDGATPVIRDMAMAAGAYKAGQVLVIDSSGRLAAGTASVTEVTAICQETDASVANDDELKVALVTASQVWRASMDASSTAGKVGYDKKYDVTATGMGIDADDKENGRMVLVDTGTDDEGNVLGYVLFSVPTFGNALA